MVIGVLALQGAFIEHEDAMHRLGADTVQLRNANDLKKHLDGLILPGGESTVQGKLLRELNMFDPIKEMITQGLPVLATCAGMILLAEKLENDDTVHLGTMPICVKRNAYGRQLGSFQTIDEMTGIGKIPMTFIRAPYVSEAGALVQVLATVKDKIVGVQYKNQIAVAFHPELDIDSNENSLEVHKYFNQLCKVNLTDQFQL